MTADTVLGPLAVEGWSGASAGGPAQVMVRPEQLQIGEAGSAPVAGTVESYQYFGHDAVVRVRPELDHLDDLVVRVTGGTPLTEGTRVGLTVVGPVVAWPLDQASIEEPATPPSATST
jgi:iron(III) transport system ATP-binding protein